MTEPSPFSTRLDHRMPRPLRPIWLGVKWTLAGMGAYLLVGHYVLTWGWSATLWFLGAPFAVGIWRGITVLQGTDPASPPPRP